MQAIQTKYHGPTNHKPSRISATWMESGKRVYVSWACELDVRDNHEAAARVRLANNDKFFDIVGGSIKSGYVWVLVQKN